MELIDELISAAQTFYDDARANENGRSRSWEHCYRVFRDARTGPSPDYDYLSLHLAFYLASWGMYRGSCFLLQKDYKVLSPTVEKILKPEYDCLFGLACADLRNDDVRAQLKELYDKKTELENLEIINTVRSMVMDKDQIMAFLSSMKGGTKPAENTEVIDNA